jgi:hypothetical protein
MSIPPNPPPAYPPSPGYPQSGEPYPQTFSAPRTGLATAALVLGIISLPTTCVCIGPVVGLVAVILGIVAAARAGSQPVAYGGRGRAVAGIATGGVPVVLLLVVLVVASLNPGAFRARLSKLFRATQAAANLQNVGTALNAYQATYQEYPPDLATLARSTPIQATPLPGASSDPTAGVWYVAGVKATDPPDWIIAYAPTTVWRGSVVIVLRVAGRPDVLDQPRFDEALAKFKQAYESRRGEPPTILPPPAEPGSQSSEKP